MSIQWYPGHMHKARRQIEELLPNVDLIIEVLDARIPASSENPLIATLRGIKPCIKIMNKSDLADPLVTQQWQDYLEQEQGVGSIALSKDQADKIARITALCRSLLPAKERSPKPIHAMIMGIPNVGKSTLINALAGRIIAKTGNEPAITKGQQKIALRNGIVLFDTPGMLWPKVENENSGYRLAITGAIKDTALDYDDIAFYAAAYLLRHYPQQLQERYQLETLPETELDFLEQIGKLRGCLGARGKVDLDKTGKLFITEFRSGALGPVSLETPAMIAQENITVAAEKARKLAEKAARKKNFRSKQKR